MNPDDNGASGITGADATGNRGMTYSVPVMPNPSADASTSEQSWGSLDRLVNERAELAEASEQDVHGEPVERGTQGDNAGGGAGPGDASWRPIVELTQGSTIPFPIDALPVPMAAAVTEVADAVKVDPAIPGCAALGVLAGLIGPWTELVIIETWRVRCNLYFCTVANSADGKSPGSSPFWHPLVQRERELKAEHEHRVREANVMLPVLQRQLKEMQKSDTANPTAMAEKAELIEKFEQVRDRTVAVWSDDVTFEQLAALMADNGGASTAINDEGTIFKHLMGTYSKNPNDSIFLKGWEGTPAKIDRKGGNGTPATAVYLERPLLTLIAAIQPTVAARLGNTAGLAERGALGRVQWAWPPTKAGTRMMAGHNPAPYRWLPAWNKQVLELTDGGERTVIVDRAAREVFNAWHDGVEAGLRSGGFYHELRNFAPKTRDSVARIAGLFARVDGAATVTVDHMARAIRLGDFFLSHAGALVESWASGSVGASLKLLSKIRAEARPGRDYTDCSGVPDGVAAFTVRDATRWCRIKAEEILEALEVLEAHGYVRPADLQVGFGEPGRRVRKPSPVVLVNPALWTENQR